MRSARDRVLGVLIMAVVAVLAVVFLVNDATAPARPDSTGADQVPQADRPSTNASPEHIPAEGDSEYLPLPDSPVAPETAAPDTTVAEVTFPGPVVSVALRVRVVLSDKSPAVGAQVTLQAANRLTTDLSDWQLPSPWTACASATTNGAGEATLECSLATDGDGRRLVQAVARLEGFAPGHSSIQSVTAHDARPLLLITLMPAATVTGQLVGPDDQPVGGASVRLFLLRASQHHAVASTRSDDEGRFRLEDVPVQTVMYEIRAAGFAVPRTWDTRFEPTAPLHDLGVINLGATGALQGRIIDSEGRPVPNAQVYVSKLPSNFGRTETVVSVADGSFSFPTMSGGPGSYVLVARAAGFQQSSLPDVTVRASQTTEVGDVVLQAGLELVVHVEDAGGRPLAGALVRLAFDGEHSEVGFYWQRQAHRALADEAGKATLRSLSPGPFRLVVTADGCAPYAETLEVQSSLEKRVALAAGGSVAGRLLDANGAPAENALVGLISHEHWAYSEFKKGELNLHDPAWPGMTTRPSVRTGSDGLFRIRDLPAGAFLLVASDAAGTSLLTHDSVGAHPGAETQIGDLRFTAPSSLTIEVQENGSALPGLELLVTGASLRRYVKTDGTGQSVLHGLDAGEYQVALPGERSDREFASMQSRRVTIRAGEHARLALDFPGQGVRVSGRFTLAGAAVFRTVFAEGLSVTYQTDVDERGNYVFRSMIPGEYVLTLHGIAGSPEPLPLTVQAGRSLEFSRDFAGASISGRVVRPDGSAAEGVTVSLRAAAVGSHTLRATTVAAGANGTFRFDAVAAGKWRVGAGDENDGVVLELETGAADVAGIELKLGTAGSIAIVVEAMVGDASFTGQQVRLRDKSGMLLPQSGGMMPAVGAVALIPGVPAGEYSVEMTGYGYACSEAVSAVVKAGERTEVRVTLEATASAELTLSGDGLTPASIALAQVEWQNEAGGKVALPWPYGRARQRGMVLDIPDLPRGVARLVVRVPGYADASVPINYAPGSQVKLQVAISR